MASLVFQRHTIGLFPSAAIGTFLLTSATLAGTAQLVKDIRPGSQSGILVQRFVSTEDFYVFSADDGVHGSEPWVTDGTFDGTFLLQDIYANGSSSPSFLGVHSGRVYFSAQVPTSETTFGFHLFVTDGTIVGTYKVDDAPFDVFPEGFGILGNQVFFRGETESWGNQFWVTDGTPAGTAPLLSGQYDISPSNWRVIGQRILFAGNSSPGQQNYELWTTDLTPENTQLLHEILPETHRGAWPGGFLQFGDGVLFSTGYDSTGLGHFQIWALDSLDSLQLVRSFGAGSAGSLQAFHDFILFVNDASSGTGREIWTSDGSTAGTQLLSDIWPGSGSGVEFGFGRVGSPAVNPPLRWFWGNDGTQSGPWITDGTSAGTFRLTDNDLGMGDSSRPLGVRVGSLAFFAAIDGTFAPWHGNELWVTDGTAEGTSLHCDMQPGANSSSPVPWGVLNGRLLVSATVTSGIGRELYLVDIPECGNDAVELGEECDDGNSIDNDGCSALCLTESAPIPTISSWGLIVLALGIGVWGSLLLRSRRLATIPE